MRRLAHRLLRRLVRRARRAARDEQLAEMAVVLRKPSRKVRGQQHKLRGASH